MGRGSFVRLTNNAMRSMEDAVDCGATQDPYGGERHGDGKESAGVFEDGAEGIGIWFGIRQKNLVTEK